MRVALLVVWRPQVTWYDAFARDASTEWVNVQFADGATGFKVRRARTPRRPAPLRLQPARSSCEAVRPAAAQQASNPRGAFANPLCTGACPVGLPFAGAQSCYGLAFKVQMVDVYINDATGEMRAASQWFAGTLATGSVQHTCQAAPSGAPLRLGGLRVRQVRGVGGVQRSQAAPVSESKLPGGPCKCAAVAPRRRALRSGWEAPLEPACTGRWGEVWVRAARWGSVLGQRVGAALWGSALG